MDIHNQHKNSISTSDEPEPSWLELKDFQLSSDRDPFASARTYFFQLENQKIAIFCMELKKLHTKNFSVLCFMKKENF